MKLSRRAFIHAGCAVAAITLVPNPVEAWVRGRAIAATLNRSTINARFSADLYLNIAKGFGSFTFAGGSTPAILNADQYPTGILPGNYAGNVAVDPTYYGRYTLKWTTVSCFQISAMPTIIYSGGAGVFGITPAASGTAVDGNTSWVNQSNKPSDQNSEFAFGALVTGVSGGSGSLVTITTPSLRFGAGLPTGTKIKLGNGISANLAVGPNDDGSWTATNVSAISFTLDNSTGVTSPTITGSGGPGVQTEAIISRNQLTVTYLASIATYGTITHNFSNFILCQTANLADITAGKLISQAAIDAVVALKPKYIRYMDMMATQSFYSDFNYRFPASGLLYDSNSQWVPSLYFGNTAGSGDAFTINSGRAGARVDGEILQFTANRSSSTNKPTLNDNSRGTDPLFNSSYIPLYFPLTGTTTTGDVISIVFTGAYLPAGAYTFTYTVVAGDTSIDVLGGHLQTALAADGVLAGLNFQFGNAGQGNVYGYYAASNGALVVTSSTSGAATEVCTPGTTLAGSTVFFVVQGNTFISGRSYTCIYNALLGGWVITGDNRGLASGVPLEAIAEISNRATAAAGAPIGAWLCPPMPYTLASYSLLGAWFAANMPNIPVLCEPMNEVWNSSANPFSQCLAQGASLGFAGTGGDFFRAAYSYYGLICAQILPAFATGYTGAGGSRSNVSLSLQNWALDATGNPSNSTMVPYRWNGGLLTGTPATCNGTISGTTLTTSGTVTGLIYPGFVLSGAGVTAGTRVQKQLSGAGHGAGTYQVSVSQTVASPVAMTLSNPLYTAVAGPGGTAGTNYNAYPNRPIDLVDSIGYACYWTGALTGGGPTGAGAAAMRGTQSFYNVLFQASLDFANGLTTQALNAFDVDQRSGTRNGTLGDTTPAGYLLPTVSGNSGVCQAFENLCGGYDGAGRPSGKANLSITQYEGGWATTFAANYQTPTVITTSPTELNAQFTANGWTLFPAYGASNLAVATNIVNLAIAYQGSAQFAATQLYFYQQMAIIHAARPSFSPGEYGLEGPSAWEMYPGNLSTAHWGNFNGVAAYNH